MQFHTRGIGIFRIPIEQVTFNYAYNFVTHIDSTSS